MKNEQKTTICTRDKKEVCLELLKNDHVLVHVNAKTEGVVVPDSFRSEIGLLLRLSYLFVGELLVGDDAINVTLRFSGKYVNCVIPWNAIWAMTSDTGDMLVWPESLPADMFESMGPVKQTVKALRGKLASTLTVKKPGKKSLIVDATDKTPDYNEHAASTTDKQAQEQTLEQPEQSDERAQDRQEKRRSLLKLVK